MESGGAGATHLNRRTFGYLVTDFVVPCAVLVRCMVFGGTLFVQNIADMLFGFLMGLFFFRLLDTVCERYFLLVQKLGDLSLHRFLLRC